MNSFVCVSKFLTFAHIENRPPPPWRTEKEDAMNILQSTSLDNQLSRLDIYLFVEMIGCPGCTITGTDSMDLWASFIALVVAASSVCCFAE